MAKTLSKSKKPNWAVFCQAGEYVSIAAAAAGASNLCEDWGTFTFGIGLVAGIALFVFRITKLKIMDAKIKYTDSGEKEIDLFQNDQKALLEKYIAREKYIMGDNEIEVTGSDIIRLKSKMEIHFRSNRLFSSSALILISYLSVILGIGLTFFGFYYEYFKELFTSNSTQVMMALLGITVTMFGLIFAVIFKMKNKKQKEYDEKRRIIKELTDRIIV